MSNIIRIGSRDSKLASWQAEEVQQQLAQKGIQSEIIYKKSVGDLVQDKPLHEIGKNTPITSGVFTKVLDDALLNHEIDIAVHSCKDLPSVLHPKLQLCAYLKREIHNDVIVSNKEIDFLENKNFRGTIATGSVRRKAQILAQFPNATVVGLRGNVPTRLNKLKENNWDGAVFALAGLKRLRIEPKFCKKAEFMISAPAQGVVAIACRKGEQNIIELCSTINHAETEFTTEIERKFLRLMEGGCISPIGGYAQIERDKVTMTVSILAIDGSEKIEFTKSVDKNDANKLAELVYLEAQQRGAVQLIKNIENNA